jgi:putative oxidoreductase
MMSELRSSNQTSIHPAYDDVRSDYVLLVARVCMASVFVFSGATKLLGWQLAIAEVEQLGVPLPWIAAVATVVVQLIGGLAVALGWHFRTAAASLAAFTFVATLVGHRFWVFDGAEFHRQLTTALEHLAIVGGFLFLMITGPGHLALQSERER